jgi:phospho-N-acetylmuramoyl-pentapeptide-transferase
MPISLLAGSFLAGVVVALVAGRVLIPLLQRLKARQFISTDAPERHQTKAGTPTMGGAIILAGGILPSLLYLGPADSGLLVAVILCTLAFGAVGLLDDYLIVSRGRNLGLRAREKLAGQFIAAIAFVAWYFLAGYAKPPTFLGGASSTVAYWLLAAYYVLLLVGMSNAVNLTDGLDGLAAGVSLPVWTVLALTGTFAGMLLPQEAGDPGVIAFCAAFAGSTLGYLWYNAHPAQVFMGDTGSLPIGGAMAAAAIALRQEWLLLVAAFIHLVEAASVTLQVISFKTTGRRIFRMSPLHHHFELCEVPETRIVARFAIASALCGLLALLLVFGWS